MLCSRTTQATPGFRAGQEIDQVHGPRGASADPHTRALSVQASSIAKMQEQASAAVMDGLIHPQVKSLSRLGCGGIYGGNFERDFFRKSRKMYKFKTQPTLVTVPRFNRAKGRLCTAEAAVVAPHGRIHLNSQTYLVCQPPLKTIPGRCNEMYFRPDEQFVTENDTENDVNPFHFRTENTNMICKPPQHKMDKAI